MIRRQSSEISFKWNPFTLKGEAPSSLRYVGDDEEFATKEDLEAIQKSPELTKVYNAMKAGVNKKFQGYNDNLKKVSDQLASTQDVLGQWESWRPVVEWYTTQYPELGPADEGYVTPSDVTPNKKVKVGKEDGALIDSLKTFQDEVRSMAGDFSKELNTMRRMYDLQLQLTDLYRAHPDMDAKKVLDIALKKGYNDLTDAYESAYRDDIIKTQVEAGVKTRVDEELAKAKVNVETGAGTIPTHFELPKAVPKTMSEASKDVLTEIRAGTLQK